jgi:hypothetical protein
MIREAFNRLSSLRLTFYLLLAVAALLLGGSISASQNYALFTTMNGVPLIFWLRVHLLKDWPVCVWLLFLILVLLILALNTFCCSLSRLSTLYRERSIRTGRRLFFALMPSLIHLSFLIILAGHLATFTMGWVDHHPVQVGKEIQISKASGNWKVASIERRLFPSHSKLKNRLSQVTVDLVTENGVKRQVSFMNPVYHDGVFLFLDMKKVKRQQVVEQEDCDQSSLFKQSKVQAQPDRQIRLMTVRDPGLPILVAGFVLINVLMLLYYIGRPRPGNNA